MHSKYLLPTDTIILLDLYLNLSKKSNLNAGINTI